MLTQQVFVTGLSPNHRLTFNFESFLHPADSKIDVIMKLLHHFLVVTLALTLALCSNSFGQTLENPSDPSQVLCSKRLFIQFQIHYISLIFLMSPFSKLFQNLFL